MLDTGLRVLIAASEVAPFAKTGGLADVAGSLPKALSLQGNDVRVVLPRYKNTDWERTVTDFPVNVSGRKETCIVRVSHIEAKSDQGVRNILVYMLDNYHYFDRDRYYMYPDEAERFAFFDRAIMALCEHTDFYPDVVHCNDWQTGFVPFLIRERAQINSRWRQVGSVYTIHNLRYQGTFPRSTLDVLGVGQEHFNPEGVEFYGNVSFMKAGIVYADVINTVSDNYAREIQTSELGEGMEGILRKRKADLYGIVNGLNYHEFDPASDPRIFHPYDSESIENKRENKNGLQRELGLELADGPLMGVVSRLVDQKGLDILVPAVEQVLSKSGGQLVILGTGDRHYEEACIGLQARYPERVRTIIGFNGTLAQKIYAGSDMFLMPSKFEPCGLGQLIAMRYGSVPVVRKTGGLADTVKSYDKMTKSGSGFVFDVYTAGAFRDAIEDAYEVYSDKETWNHLVRNIMQTDYSWNKSAALYTELYIEALGRKRKVERPA